jgi:hypothetical protein
MLEVPVLIVATIAAIASVLGLLQHRRGTLHQQLLDLADLADEIRVTIDGGRLSSVRRDDAQRRLSNRLGSRGGLPHTHRLASTELHADTGSRDLAIAATSELEAALERPLVRSR